MPPTEERPTTPPRPGFLWVYKWDPTYGTHNWVEEADPDYVAAPATPKSSQMNPEEAAWYKAKEDWEGFTVGGISYPGTGGGKPFRVPPPASLPDADYYLRAGYIPEQPEQPGGSSLNTRSGDLKLADGTVIKGWDPYIGYRQGAKSPPNYGSWTDENGVIRANKGPGEAGRSQSQSTPSFSFTPKNTAAAAPKMEQAYAGAVPLPKAQAAKPWIPDSWRARPGRDKVGGQAKPRFSWNPWQRKV